MKLTHVRVDGMNLGRLDFQGASGGGKIGIGQFSKQKVFSMETSATCLLRCNCFGLLSTKLQRASSRRLLAKFGGNVTGCIWYAQHAQ